MRIIETILKVSFLVLAICLIVTKDIEGYYFLSLVAVSIILGLVLLFNKNSSYGSWGNARKDYSMRRLEGVILILAGFAGYFLK